MIVLATHHQSQSGTGALAEVLGNARTVLGSKSDKINDGSGTSAGKNRRSAGPSRDKLSRVHHTR